jgi:multimeric flavodoxin WrbA
MPKTKYEVKYKLKDKKTGRLTNSGQQTVQSESETNAIAQIKKLFQNHEVEIVAVTPKK